MVKVSSVWLRALRPKPVAGDHLLYNYPSIGNESSLTKIGVPPNLTGVPLVPPTVLDVQR